MQHNKIVVPVHNNDTFYRIWEKVIPAAHNLEITGLSESMTADVIREACGYIYTSDYLPWHMGPTSISLMILDPGGICDGLTKFVDIHRVVRNWYYDTYEEKSQDRSIHINSGLLEQNFIYAVVPGIYLACGYQGYSVD